MITNRTKLLRERILRHMWMLPHLYEDLSFNPMFWSEWQFPWEGGTVRVFHQRWIKGLRRFQTNYIKVTKDGERLLVKDLFRLANWLTDERAKIITAAQKGERNRDGQAD